MSLKLMVAAVAGATAWIGLAENLVTGGDFSSAAADLAPECRADDGRLSLFTEHLTWNKCGKCEVDRGRPDREHPGCTTHAANVLIGAKDGKAGFPVDGGTSYEFAVDVKGSVSGVALAAVCWTGDDYWKDRQVVKIPLADASVSDEWSIKKGSFRTPANARRAALRLSVWSSSKWQNRPQLKVGDHFLFDNVKVEKSRKNLDLGDAAQPAAAVKVKKTVAPGDAFDDFINFKDGKTPALAKTHVRVRRVDAAFVIDVTAEDPDGLVVGKPEKVWSGDTIELQFGGKDDGRVKTHLAFNAAGGKYTAGSDAISNDGWELRTKVEGNRWRATVKVPFAFLGWREPKGEIPFTVGRARPKARTFDVWSADGGSFQDVNGWGRIVLDGYAAAFKAAFGVETELADRAAFEARFAAETASRQAAKFAKFKAAKFSVAPVPVVSAWTQPYLPEEIFDPPTEIELKAAVNEIRALPLAIANLTDRTEDYRVVLETESNEHVGAWGLEGFPAERIVARKGLRFKDVTNPDPSTRFDPLPRLDDVGSVTVPPKEAGLVWYDFDCTGVAPGVYKGRLRVIPLCEEGAFKKETYTGKMQTIPVSLEVVNAEISNRPSVPAGYFMGVESQAAFDTAFQIGAEQFQVHSWSFGFERDAHGDLDLTRPTPRAIHVATVVSNHVAWARKHGFTPKFSIVYSAMDACKGLYGCGKDPEKFKRYWPQYVRAVKHTMNAAGVPDADYFIEVRDEPNAEVLDELLLAHKLAKETEPTVRLAMLLAAWALPMEKVEAFAPYADLWFIWRGKFDNKDYCAFLKRQQAAGREVAHYSCDVTMRLPLQGYYRHHAWFADYHGLDGAWMYQLTDHFGGGKFGYKDFKSIPYGGLFYRSFGEPVPSLRLMALREGFTDCKFLAALRRKNETANDPEIAAFLKTAAEQVIVRRPNDTALPDRLRDRARELLCRRKERPTADYDVREFGAKGDGATLDTAAIQKTIDAAAAAGGGTVVVPAGTYLSGALFFKKGTKLRLDEGAVVRGSTEIRDYPEMMTRIEGETCLYYPALVNADGVDGFSVEGKGTLDGNGYVYWCRLNARSRRIPGTENKDEPRPRLLYVSNAKHVSVRGITLKNSAYWTTHFYKCEDVTLEDLRIFTEVVNGVAGENPDAVDLDAVKTVRIRRCFMDVPNDAITLKGGKGPTVHDPKLSPESGAVEDVVVENCSFGRQCTGCLTFGSECFSGRDVVLRDCTVENVKTVLRLKMRPDTKQVYGPARVENIRGTAEHALVVAPYASHARPEWKALHLKSVARDITVRVGSELRCLKSPSVLAPSDDYTLERVACE